MILLLLWAGAGPAQASLPVVDTHDGFGRALVSQERRHKPEQRTDQVSVIAAEMRAALAPNAALPQPKAPGIINALPLPDLELDDEEAILAFI